MSQSELASLTAISLPTLKRIMRRFGDGGLIDHHYGRIRVVDRDALLRICRS